MTVSTPPPSVEELRALEAAATKGPWEYMSGRGMIRAIRGDLAIPLFETLTPFADPDAEAPTVRVGGVVLFRAGSGGAKDSAALKREAANGRLVAAMHAALPGILSSTAKDKARIVELEAALRAIAHETRRQQLPITARIHEMAMAYRATQAEADAARNTQSGWLPIADAAQDPGGPLVDLWCVPPDDVDFMPEAGGVRLTDCGWHIADEIFPHTGWARVTDDGNYDLIDSGPTCAFGLPRWVPKYFMPLPAPPQHGEDVA